MFRAAGALVALVLCCAPASARGDVHALVTQAALRHGVPVALAHAVAHGESRHRCDAKNARSSASGVFQIIDSTARGLRINKHDCRQNIDGGVRLLKVAMRSKARLCATYEATCKRSFRVASR